MKLIEDWKQAYKFLSVNVSAIASTALVVWIALPQDQQAAILSAVGLNGPAVLALGGFIAVIVARVIAQPPKV